MTARFNARTLELTDFAPFIAFSTIFLAIGINKGMSKIFKHTQYKSDLIEEQLWNEQYLFPVTNGWNTSVVLCCYKPTDFDPLKKLARLFANKVDHKFGCLKKGKALHISQRITNE